MLSKLKHDGIAQLLSWSESTFDLQLVFPCYEEDVDAAIKRGLFRPEWPLQDDCLPYLCKQLLAALTYVHGLEILHRDVKPKNMLITAVGVSQSWKIVLSDFGSAIDAKVNIPEDVGTYQYRAPELFAQPAITGYASDTWALGVSIVHMDLGRAPFGKSMIRKAEIFDVFYDIMRQLTTWKPPSDFDHTKKRKHHDTWCAMLDNIKLKPTALPWGTKRDVSFQKFTRMFLTIGRKHRRLASQIALTEDEGFLVFGRE